MEHSKGQAKAGHLSRQDILGVAGNIDDAKIAAIEASGASLEQLEEAVAWATGESDVMGRERHALSGVVAQLYDILCADEEYDERTE